MKDPLTRAEASEFAAQAFRDLHEASKDLVDLEIVIPGPEASAAMGPVREGYMDISEHGVVVPPGYSIQDARNIPVPYDRSKGTDMGLPEYRMLVKDDDVDQLLQDLFWEPWYKRLWNWVTK